MGYFAPFPVLEKVFFLRGVASGRMTQPVQGVHSGLWVEEVLESRGGWGSASAASSGFWSERARGQETVTLPIAFTCIVSLVSRQAYFLDGRAKPREAQDTQLITGRVRISTRPTDSKSFALNHSVHFYKTERCSGGQHVWLILE